MECNIEGQKTDLQLRP